MEEKKSAFLILAFSRCLPGDSQAKVSKWRESSIYTQLRGRNWGATCLVRIVIGVFQKHSLKTESSFC